VRHDNPLPREADLPYVDDINAAMLETTPTHTRRVLYLIACVTFSFVLWAAWAKVDEVTVGQGRVIPSQQTQVVQNLEGGILAQIFVSEGQHVARGEPLVRLDDTRFRSDLRGSEEELASLQGLVARLKAQLASVNIKENGSLLQVRIEPQPLVLPANFGAQFAAVVEREQQALNSQLQSLADQLAAAEQQEAQRGQEVRELESRITHLQESNRLVQEELRLTAPLAKEGAVSKVELIKLQRQVNDLQSELSAARLNLPKIRFAQAEARAKHDELASRFRAEARETLNQKEAELAKLSESQVGIQDRVERTLLGSPVHGTIKKIHINTVGGVVQPGMAIMEIVPLEESLLVEARVQPKDIAFLRPGLPAIVKFSAYDFAIYGGISGTVEHISADTIEDEEKKPFYLVRVRTEHSYLGDAQQGLPIIPGMLAQVDVITGKKSVLDYLLKPILRARKQALRER
jgi:membrane fusion protein, adhesin transport system